MNIFNFNKVVYKGNVNIDFYFYCLKKDIKLIKFLFYNIYNYLISLIIKKHKYLYEKRKYQYLKHINNLNKEIDLFYKNKNRYNSYLDVEKDIIIDRVPKVFIDSKLSKKIIAYDLNKNYEVELEKYNKELEKIKKANNLYIRNSYELQNITFNKLFVVNNNNLKHLTNRKKINDNLILIFVMLLLSFILTCISFCYTNYVLDMDMIKTYFELKLFLLNFIPIFLLILLLYLIFKHLHLSFFITSLVLMVLAISNQTKVMYRDDVVKFEDLTLIKEALTMSTRYDIIIRWYTVLFVILLIVIYFFTKRYIKKLNISIKKRLLYIGLTIVLMFLGYKNIYLSYDIYASVGDESLINIWIGTRQLQIRGLVYPFIYTSNEIIDTKPENYEEDVAINLLKQYKYTDIDEDKKVNIIAIMLEAYNDFTKFDMLDFNENIYEKLHNIQNESITGNLVTTVFGGGTIVTERNFLTGYYDFPSFRKNTNSYVWYFKEQGYRTEAMHPIYGAFYNRASYNPNLGFDIYYNYENKFSGIQSEFLDDNRFFDYIIEGYERAKKSNIPYFNFSVTYQNHGPYSSEEYDDKEYFFDNTGYDTVAYNTINEYFSGIKKTNDALEKIINYFDNEDKPVIVMFFGDHNPYLGDTGYEKLGINLDLSTIEGFKNYYETFYVIHANERAKEMFGKDFVGKGNTISPIFLMNELFDYIDLNGNEYLQYMSNLKKDIDVIGEYYYKINGEFVKKEDNKLIDEYDIVNYYHSRNFKEEK